VFLRRHGRRGKRESRCMYTYTNEERENKKKKKKKKRKKHKHCCEEIQGERENC